MHLLERSPLLLLGLALTACASAPTPPAPAEPAPVVDEPAATTPPSGEPEPISAAEPEPPGPPAPPPRALAASDAFYILDVAGTASKPAAKICDSDATCEPLVPGENHQVVRDFAGENWLVITAPADHEHAVVSDGKTATVTLKPRCSATDDQRGPRIVLYRVAKSVTAAKVNPTSKTCPKPR